jgi:hypothetical protein
MSLCFVEVWYIATDRPMGLTNNIIYWHYNSDSWNRTLTRISRTTHKSLTCTCTFSNSGLIALSVVYSVFLSTDTNLEHSTSQIHSHTHSTLCISSAKSPSLSAIHSSLCYKPSTDSHDTTIPHLTVCWPNVLFICHLEPLLLLQLVLNIPF